MQIYADTPQIHCYETKWSVDQHKLELCRLQNLLIKAVCGGGGGAEGPAWMRMHQDRGTLGDLVL